MCRRCGSPRGARRRRLCDDLLIVPLGIMLAVRLIPAALIALYRREAAALQLSPKSVVAAIVVVAIWLAALYGVWAWARS